MGVIGQAIQFYGVSEMRSLPNVRWVEGQLTEGREKHARTPNHKRSWTSEAHCSYLPNLKPRSLNASPMKS